MSALGAGALILAPKNADASVVTYTGPPITLGIGQSWQSGQSWNGNPTPLLPGGVGAQFAFSAYICSCGLGIAAAFPNRKLWFTYVPLPMTNGTRLYPFLNLVNYGAVQTRQYRAGGAVHPLDLASFKSTGTGPPSHRYLKSGGQEQFSNRFALFSFEPSAGIYDFGWIELSLSAAAYPLTMQLTIQQYAFDNDGYPMFAGGGEMTPEPGTFGSTGLAALALGAVGLRRWRAARKKAE